MKIFFSSGSPFVRKVMVVAHELGLSERIEKLPAAAGPVARDASIREHNPLGQVPTLLSDGGTALYDSRVICEYLDDLGGNRLFGEGAARWRNLTDQALADGLMGAAVLTRYEAVLRPEPLRWTGWTEGQTGKIGDALARFETAATDFGDRLDIGTISLACGLGYLDFRFADMDWRRTHQNLAGWFGSFGERASLKATRPSA